MMNNELQMKVEDKKMNQFQMFRVAAAAPEVVVGDPFANADTIRKKALEAEKQGAAVVLFPELCLTGYTAADLFGQKLLLDGAEKALDAICRFSAEHAIALVVGLPVRAGGALYNCGVFVSGGDVLGAVPKCFLPNSREFYEKRWFQSGLQANEDHVRLCGRDVPFGTRLLFRAKAMPEAVIGIEVCEDLWAPVPPSTELALGGATVILNLSASDALIGKHAYREDLVRQQSARLNAAYVYASCGMGESTTDVVFDADLAVAEKGKLLAQSEPFSEDEPLLVCDIDIESLIHDRMTQTSFGDAMSTAPACRVIDFNAQDADNWIRPVDPAPFVPADEKARVAHCEEIFNIQTMGLVTRLKKIGTPPMIVGISGGLDSTLALLVCAAACDRLHISRKQIHAVTMPGFGTTDRTYDNAVALIEGLGATFHEIGIAEAVKAHFADIGHDIHVHDVTYENAQARERTQILMDLANRFGGIVVGTGDLSELALGWATYNGDHMSMYGVNGGIPKTLVRYVVRTIAGMAAYADIKAVLTDVLDTPVSPELLPPEEDGTISQQTEDIVGPYELHDFFLFHMIRNGFSPQKIFVMARVAFDGLYDDKTIKHWLVIFMRRFFAQQFKRSCLPDGPKVGSVALSPRGDWRMPSDASASLWVAEAEKIIVK